MSHENGFFKKFDGKKSSYFEFFETCLLNNQPALIENIGSDTWPCRKFWSSNDVDLDISKILDLYKNLTVPVYFCDEIYFNSQKCLDLPMPEFCQRFSKNENVYLKDWHLQKSQIKNHKSFYSVPIFFQSDFLNEFADISGSDDYRFVYMGNGGTSTPFHKDVLSSFSWSVNVIGLKSWIFIEEGREERLLFDAREANRRAGLGDFYPRDVRPYLQDCQERDQLHCQFVQKSDNAVFVPSNVYHQVENLCPTASVNHNWVNATNIRKMYQHLLDELNLVEKEIDHLRDSMDNFEEHSQILLKACCGMNLADLEKFLSVILASREERLEQYTDCRYFETTEKVLAAARERPSNFTPGSKLHDNFDALEITNVLRALKKLLESKPGSAEP